MSAGGAVVGLLAGVGILLAALAWIAPRAPQPVARRRTTARQIAWSVLAATAGFAAALLVTAIPVMALIAAAVGGAAPVVIRRRRQARAGRAVRAAWPDAVDHLVSAVRAGMALPQAIADVGRSGPEALRPAFARFADEYRVSGAFDDALDAMQRELADPVAARVCAALRLAYDVGGTDLAVVLSTLGSMLREEDRIRGEVEARQSWTVNAARMAVAAPWVTLAVLCTRPEAVRAYSSAAGTAVLVVAASLTWVAYRAMRRIGRLPVWDEAS